MQSPCILTDMGIMAILSGVAPYRIGHSFEAGDDEVRRKVLLRSNFAPIFTAQRYRNTPKERERGRGGGKGGGGRETEIVHT